MGQQMKERCLTQMAIHILKIMMVMVIDYSPDLGLAGVWIKEMEDIYYKEILKEAEAGDPDAQYQLGKMYYYGRGVIQN